MTERFNLGDPVMAWTSEHGHVAATFVRYGKGVDAQATAWVQVIDEDHASETGLYLVYADELTPRPAS